MVVSVAYLNQLLWIDHATGEVRWRLGVGGEIDPDPDGAFYGQHAPEIDGDRVLMHDNGRCRPDGLWSRVLELSVDFDARTAAPTVDWRGEGWFEWLWGDADRLPDGSVLVTRGHCSTCGSPDRRSDVVIVAPPGETEPRWRLWVDDPDVGVYRAQRIHGCDLFENQRYCP